MSLGEHGDQQFLDHLSLAHNGFRHFACDLLVRFVQTLDSLEVFAFEHQWFLVDQSITRRWARRGT
ncbi:MAG: hypothetical protein R3C99_02865 [Pirellulaceae bacterium]